MKKILHFFEKRYSLFLLLTVLISYGQTLFMFPWQDDHTIFFKLEHINDKAGYFGYGPIGQGSYKYIITPHFLISKIFGLNIPVYYFFVIVFYFLAAFTIYKVFAKIADRRAGMAAGFLFASGFIASDGFVRIFNSIATSSSVILISLLTLGYFLFYKEKKIKWYFLALLSFFLASELFRIRTHYLIAVVVLFEVIFLMFKKFPRSIILSAIRIIPFAYIFYNYFILNADSRSTEVSAFVKSILHGDLYLLYGFISSISHIIFPDWLTVNFIRNTRIGYVVLFLVVLCFVYIFRNDNKKKGIAILLFAFSLAWYFVSLKIFNSPTLNLGGFDFLLGFAGGVCLLLIPLLFSVLDREKRRLFLFFALWVLINIAAYSAYNPTVSYNSIQRYLAHSFFAVSGAFAVLFSFLPSKRNNLARVGMALIILWGVGNLVNSFLYQRDIVVNRSIPEKNFYSQLKSFVPKLNKGDILYFDVADSERSAFADFFSVASMPEETAIAWQYGIDRYDIRRETLYSELIALIKDGGFGDVNDKHLKLGNIYSFFYSKDGLIDTTKELNGFLSESGHVSENINFSQSDDELIFEKPLSGVVPLDLTLNIRATPSLAKDLVFPYISDARMRGNSVAVDSNLRSLAFGYGLFKKQLFTNMTVAASSEWRENIVKNLMDGNTNTVWQPDRITWHQGQENLVLDLKSVLQISSFVWVNAYENNSPTDYAVDVSFDGKKWREVKHISAVKRISSGIPTTVLFDPVNARFVRMRLIKSLNDDSPGISEVWVSLSSFSALNISDAEEFLANPFGFVGDAESFDESLREMEYMGKVQVYWKTDKSSGWTTSDASYLSVKYDGVRRNYEIIIPAGGTKVSALKIVGRQIPGDVTVDSLGWKL